MILSVTVLLGAFSIPSFAGKLKGEESTTPSLEEMQALVGISSYEKYSSQYSGVTNEGLTEPIVIDVVKNMFGDGYVVSDPANTYCDGYKAWENFDPDNEGWADKSVYLPTIGKNGTDAGSVSWTFKVENGQEGLYNLFIEYYNCSTEESSVSAIQKKLMIDGKVPFSEVGSVTFDKQWKYKDVTVLDPTEADKKYTNDDAGKSFVSYLTDGDGADAYYKVITEVYKDGGKLMQKQTKYRITQDINGNSMTPEFFESSEWSTYICSDTSGYHEGYFEFYLPYGEHTFTLDAEREPMVIRSIKFVPADVDAEEAVIESYDKYTEKYKDVANATGGIINLQAEFPDYVSDSSVVASNANDNAENFPISSKAQLFNVIGETSFSTVGQWAAYKFTVNETGMYKLAMRYKQDSLQGMFICRSIKLSGGTYGLDDGTPTVPFAEAQNVRFDYNKEWQSDFLGDYVTTGEGENAVSEKRNFEFYFEKGVEYTIYVECSLGDLREYIASVEASLNRLNECYLRIIQRTGSTPDANMDYDFFTQMPDVLVILLDEAMNLDRIANELEKLCGTTGSHLATLDTVARTVDLMGSDHGRNIAANLSTFKSYLGTLGTWITSSKSGSLIIDTICVVPADTTESIPKDKAGFFKSIWHEISSFIYSFFTNYDQMGLTVIPDENTATVDVWLAMGRDQSQIWRTMIDSSGGFTDTTKNAVALKLVTGGTLLPSILAGRGPDVYLGLGSADVINYAIRDAVLPVSGNSTALTDAENNIFNTFVYRDKDGNDERFTAEQIAAKGGQAGMEALGYTLISEDFKTFTTKTREDGMPVFAPAAMNTLTLLETTYGIPMTMSFAMMFYRMDVLAELGKEVPESWDELLKLLPDLQVNNMTIGVTYVSALDFMMYQRGGNMWRYTEDIYDPAYAGSKIGLDSDIALEAFDFVCSLYTEYSLPVTFDSANRFRTGEMPIVIGDYASIYNTLVIYATEIEGLWEFCSLPGSEYVDENGKEQFNYDSLAGVSATVIPNGCDNFEAAWEFVQWQTGAKAQATYANKIVALIGPAAKYESANLWAIEDMSWTASEKAAIRNQMRHLNAIVNYPGSYIISRYMKFAFLDAYNEGANPVEAMQSYVPAINAELARKREEFGDILKTPERPEDALKKVADDGQD